MPREVDDIARRLLAELARLAAAPLTAAMHRYSDALTALPRRCERRPGKAERRAPRRVSTGCPRR